MSTPRAPGRPRDPAVQEAISRACRELITEVGYSSLTIEAVAERAGVGRPTIYRRWPSKAHMVWDVLFSTPADAQVIGETDDLRADIEGWVASTIAFFSQPEISSAFPGLLDDRSVDQDWHSHLRNPVRKAVVARLKRGVTEGVLRADADLNAVFDVVTGFAIYRATVPQPSGRAPSVKAIVDLVLTGTLIP